MTDLDELERLEREATAGPWTFEQKTGELGAITPYDDWTIAAALPRGKYSIAYEGEAISESGVNGQLIAALRNAARELIADAKRYRWLRDKAWSVGHSAPAVCMVDESGRPYLDMDNFAADPIMEGRELDLNIDAAIAKEKQ